MSSLLRLAAAACLLPALALAAEHPSIKPGLWEFTHESDSTGQTPVPEDVLARPPPEARARLEASHQSGGALSHSSKQCITPKSEEHMFDDTAHGACTHTLISQTATSMEMHMECKGKGTGAMAAGSSGTLKWRLLNPETLQGTVDMMSVIGPRTMNHTIEIKGKWLGADCGDVKPHEGSGG